MQLQMPNFLISQELLLTERKKSSEGDKSYESDKAISIKVRTVRSSDSLSLVESVETNSRKSYSYSRLTTRRFSSTHIVGVGNVKPLEFGGVNSSAVISAWSLSRPRVNFLSPDADIHREFGADLRNLIPPDGNFAKWVSDFDSLIEDSYLGANEAQMKEETDEQRPTQGRKKAIKSFNEETLRRETSAKKIDEAGEEVTASSAVDLRISHVNSLSRKVVR
jgi:hypothetical protein